MILGVHSMTSNNKDCLTVQEAPSIHTLTLLSFIALILFSLVIFTLVVGQVISTDSDYSQPEVVSHFLDALLLQGSSGLDNTIDIYIVSDSDAEGFDNSDYLYFSYLLGDELDRITSYKLIKSEPLYTEIALYDENGEELYPRFYFAYTMSQDTEKIADYTIARLNPFSRRAEGYSRKWA